MLNFVKSVTLCLKVISVCVCKTILLLDWICLWIRWFMLIVSLQLIYCDTAYFFITLGALLKYRNGVGYTFHKFVYFIWNEIQQWKQRNHDKQKWNNIHKEEYVNCFSLTAMKVLLCSLALKGTVHPKTKSLSSLLHVVSNLLCLFSSIFHKS